MDMCFKIKFVNKTKGSLFMLYLHHIIRAMLGQTCTCIVSLSSLKKTVNMFTLLYQKSWSSLNFVKKEEEEF